VRGIRTNSVSGTFEPQEAVRRMVEGTSLAFNAEQLIVTPISRTTVPAPKGEETAHGPGSVAAITPRGLPNLINSLNPQDPSELDEVVVTGTLIRGVFDIVSPLVFVKDRQIRSAGYGSVRDALQSLPMTFGGGPSEYNDPGGNFNRGAAVNLRGLGPGATLVLVNGGRQPSAGIDGDFVDVSSIPSSAVERVELLPDGASALYGSDAIAGVVNFIMRDNFVGWETQARIGLAESGADEVTVSQMFGTKWNSGRLMLAYQYSNRDALEASDRSYSADSDKSFFGGTDFSSVRSTPGNIFDPRTQQPAFAIPSGQDGTALTVDQLIPDAVNSTNRMQYTELMPDRRIHSLYLSGSQRLGERLELFGEGRASERRVEQELAPFEQLIFVPASNPFRVDPFDLPITVVGYDFRNDLGLVSGTGRTQSYLGTVGLRSNFGETWKATVTASHGSEKLRWAARNQVDPLALAAALADPDRTTAFNPFGDGSANNPSTIEKIRITQRERADSELTTFNLVADGELLDLPAGAAKVALGANYREETFGHGVRNPQQFSRQVTSAFAEFALPIVGNPDDRRATPRLQLSLAARSEDYSDFGSTFNPKVGLQWVPFASLKLRGSWGTSFKAPDLVDLYDTTNSLSALLVVRDALSPTGRSFALIEQGSNSKLREESADTWTAGIDFAPEWVSGLAVSLTYYSINYRDRVFFLGPPLTPEQAVADPQWSSLVTRNPSQAQVEAICNGSTFRGVVQQCLASRPSLIIDARSNNLSATTVEGLDLDLSQSLLTSHGEWSFGLQGSYIWSFEQAFTTASPDVDILGTVNNPNSLRLRGSVGWDQRGADLPGFGVGLTAEHVGSYRDPLSPKLAEIDPWTRLNINLSYRLAGASGSEGIEFMLSGLNILNEAPPFVDREIGFDPANAEPLGRVVSFFVRKSW
jgi:iron complex outermembrane recepter protein